MPFTVGMKAASLPLGPEAAVSTRSSPPSASGSPKWPVALLGVAIENLSLELVLTRMAAMLAARRPHYVSIATAARLLRAQHDPALFQALADADLVLGDSTGLRWASRWLGNPLTHRIYSRELVAGVAALAIGRGLRVFVLAGQPGAAAATEAVLRRRHPKLNLVGSYAPGSREIFDDDEAAAVVRAAKPHLMLVWSENPALETWLARCHRELEVPLVVHFPGALARPAPVVPPVTSHHWRERLRNGWVLARRLWTLRKVLSSPRPDVCDGRVHRTTPEWIDIDAGESLTRAAFDGAPKIWRLHELPGAHCTFDASRVRHIDATGVAILARQRATCHRTGRHFVLVSPSEPVRRALARSRLLSLFDVAETVDAARRQFPITDPLTVTGITRSLAWCGEIIAANADDVWQMTSEYIRTFAASGATLVIIDLSRLRLVDSNGAALMLRVKQWARGVRAEVIFTHPQPQVQGVLRLTAADLLVLEGAQ